MFKSKKFIITITSVLLITITILSFYIYLLPNNLDKFIERDLVYVKNQTEFQLYTYPFQIDNSLPNKIVKLNNSWNIIKNPILTLVFNGYPSNEIYQRIWVFELERENTFSNQYRIIRRQGALVNNIPFQDIVNLASRYDLTTSFPGKENYKITNYPPLAQSEVDANLKRREADEQKTEDVQSQNQRIKTTYEVIFNKYNQYEKLLKTDNLTPDQIVTNKIMADRQLTELQILLQQIQTQLDNNQSYTFSENNITLNPDQQTKDEITQFINEVTELQK